MEKALSKNHEKKGTALNEIFKNDTSITLDWPDITGANRYHLQVNLNPDFSGSHEQDDNTLAVSTKAFTDSGANDKKRYWRWRHSTDAGATWNEWSPVASYWLDTGGADDISLANSKWNLFDPDDITDEYVLDYYPRYTIVPANIMRASVRNRRGTLLSEYLTTKAKITIVHDSDNFITPLQYAEFMRFNSEIKTFFVGAMIESIHQDTSYYRPNIWKAQIMKDPAFTMISSGNEEYYTGEIYLEEI